MLSRAARRGCGVWMAGRPPASQRPPTEATTSGCLGLEQAITFIGPNQHVRATARARPKSGERPQSAVHTQTRTHSPNTHALYTRYRVTVLLCLLMLASLTAPAAVPIGRPDVGARPPARDILDTLKTLIAKGRNAEAFPSRSPARRATAECQGVLRRASMLSSASMMREVCNGCLRELLRSDLEQVRI